MAIELFDTRGLSDDILEVLRLRAVHACQLGYTESAVAEVLGVTRETVSHWWSAYSQGGLAALPHQRTGRPVGSGRRLTAKQEQRVQDLLDTRIPEQLGIPAALWTRRAVRELIERECGVRLPIRTVGLYLRRWGYTPKKPRRHARGQDPEEVRWWLAHEYPFLELRAQFEGAEIHWGDEMGVAANEHRGRGYARVGTTPELPVSGKKFRVNQISTITNQGQVRFMTYLGTMNAAVFILFLSRLLQGAKKKIFLIVDPLPAHEAAKVQRWVAAQSGRIELFYLPAKTPERNPDEYLNQEVKGGVNAARVPDTVQELRSNLQRFMHKLAKLPEHVANYFQHPNIQFAAGM